MPATLTRTTKHIRQDLHALDQRERTAREEAAGLYVKARGEGRPLTDAEKARDGELKAQLGVVAVDRESLREELSNAEALARIECGSARIESVREASEDDPRGGYSSPVAFLADVMASTKTRVMSPRLRRFSLFRATAGSDEATTQNDPYGGFLVPAAMVAPGVRQVAPDVNPFRGRTGKITMGAARILKINARVDKDHSTSVSGGLRVYRRVETQTVTASRGQYEQVTLEKNELMGVTYAAEELLRASAEAFVSLISMGFGEEFEAKVFEEILNGDGVGRYLGIASSPALLTVSKETGQAADTITYKNLVQMMSRCYGYGNAIWYANHGCIPELASITLPGGTAPVYQVANGISTILGRPAFFGERAAALGDLGDIMCVNPAEYLEDDGAPIESASSIHVRFLEHEQTFKFWTENAGTPWWRTVLTPKRGPTLSPYVYLAARA